MKNGHFRKNHTSLTEEIGNYPLFYAPQISQLNSPTISQTISSLLLSRQQKCFLVGGGEECGYFLE